MQHVMQCFRPFNVQKTKKVTWGKVTVTKYYLEEGETLGKRKVEKKCSKVVIPEEYKDIVNSVCGADALCMVRAEPKKIVKSEEHSDMLAALGML